MRTPSSPPFQALALIGRGFPPHLLSVSIALPSGSSSLSVASATGSGSALNAEHEIAQRARRLAARPREPRRDRPAERRVLAEMRRLESEHLAAFAHRRLDFGELRAAARGDHELGGLVGHDAVVAARIEHLAFERLAVEILGAAAAHSQRALRSSRIAHRFGQLLERRIHCVVPHHPRIS